MRELTLELGTEMLLVGGVQTSRGAARKVLERALADGSALERFARMVRAHGGDVRAVEEPHRLPRARATAVVTAKRSGYVTAIDPLALGWCSVALGAGRARAEDPVDPAAGVELLATRGSRVEKGQPLARLHASSSPKTKLEAPRVLAAFELGARPPRQSPLVVARLR